MFHHCDSLLVTICLLGSKKRGAASNDDGNDDADHGDGDSDDGDNVDDDDDEGGQDVKVMESLAKKPRCQQMQPNCRYSLAMKMIVMRNMMIMRMINITSKYNDNEIMFHYRRYR